MPHPMVAPKVVAIVADDLTGANDTAVQFVEGNWRTDLLVGDPETNSSKPVEEPRRAFAVTADNRALTGRTAEAATRRSVTVALEQNAEALYLKVDSTLRGSINEQIRAGVATWRETVPGAFAILCPAYPRMRRTVENGVLLVDGVPVSETGIAHDPVTPVTRSRLLELVDGSELLAQPGETVVNAVRRRAEDPGSAGKVFVVDARDNQELADLADAIARTTPGLVVPVGSAGLAFALANAWATGSRAEAKRCSNDMTPPSPMLIQVTSLNAVSRLQLAELVGKADDLGVAALQPPLDVVLDADRLTMWVRARWDEVTAAEVVVLAAPEHRARDVADSALIASNLGAVSAWLSDELDLRVLGLIGGDGARAVFAALSVSTVRVIDAHEEGVPIGITADGERAGLIVVTKAGGFGAPSSLITMVERFARPASRRIQ